MTRQNLLKLAESFRHAILYLIREAHHNGFRLIGTSLKEAERAIDEELTARGLLKNGHGDGPEDAGSDLNRKQ